MKKKQEEPLLTITQAAWLLGVSERTIRRWIDTKDLIPIRIGGSIRFERAKILNRAKGK